MSYYIREVKHHSLTYLYIIKLVNNCGSFTKTKVWQSAGFRSDNGQAKAQTAADAVLKALSI